MRFGNKERSSSASQKISHCQLVSFNYLFPQIQRFVSAFLLEMGLSRILISFGTPLLNSIIKRRHVFIYPLIFNEVTDARYYFVLIGVKTKNCNIRFFLNIFSRLYALNAYVQKESLTNQPSYQETKLKSQQQQYHFFGVESTAVCIDLLKQIVIYRLISALLMTLLHHFSFSAWHNFQQLSNFYLHVF